jgi:hypothetical protein
LHRTGAIDWGSLPLRTFLANVEIHETAFHAVPAKTSFRVRAKTDLCADYNCSGNLIRRLADFALSRANLVFLTSDEWDTRAIGIHVFLGTRLGTSVLPRALSSRPIAASSEIARTVAHKDPDATYPLTFFGAFRIC